MNENGNGTGTGASADPVQKDLPIGTYQHFKGPTYRVLGVIRYREDARASASLWVRAFESGRESDDTAARIVIFRDGDGAFFDDGALRGRLGDDFLVLYYPLERRELLTVRSFDEFTGYARGSHDKRFVLIEEEPA